MNGPQVLVYKIILAGVNLSVLKPHCGGEEELSIHSLTLLYIRKEATFFIFFFRVEQLEE